MVFSFPKTLTIIGALLLLSAGAAHGSTEYEIVGLQGEKATKYPASERGATREYLTFRNAAGTHRIIYEEASSAQPLPGIEGLRNVMGNKELVCQLALICKTTAFCTGGCKNIYYEMSNTPLDAALNDRNNCLISTFKCDKAPLSGGANGR